MNVSLRQLRAFTAVADRASFTEAARGLHLTQSAVSMLVRQLESELGLLLFDRCGKNVAVTAAAAELLPVARRMLDDLDRVITGALDIRTLKRGTLRLGVTQMLACTGIPEIVASFEALYPDVAIKVVDTSVDELVDIVRRADVDIGIGPERHTDEDIDREFLCWVPMCLICPSTHPLANRGSVSWHEVLGERWIIYSSEFTQELINTLERHHVSLRVGDATEVRYITTAVSMIGRGLGVTVAPDYVRSLAAHFGASAVTLDGPSIERRFFAYTRHDQAPTPVAQAFEDLLKARIAQRSGEPFASIAGSVPAAPAM